MACVVKAQSPREGPLAAMPLRFAAQQAVEGMLWLTLPVAPQDAQASALTLIFLIYAKVLWPVYAPLATLLIEPDAGRRNLMRLILCGAVAVSYTHLTLPTIYSV